MMQHPLRVLSLCSGIGAIDYACVLAGMEIAGQVELDPFCQKVLVKQFPHVAKRKDIKEVVGDEFGTVDIIVGGIPCFIAGTMILTKRGYVPIEEVVIGDEVLTHLGRWRNVTSVMVRENANLYKVKAQGTPDIITTNEHPFYTRKQTPKWNNAIRRYERTFSDPEWVEAQDLSKQCYVGQVLPVEIVDDEQSCAFWWLVGRYLADGWRVKRPQRKTGGWITIACAHHEVEEVKQRIQAAGYNIIVSPERAVTKIRIAHVGLYNYLEQFGKYAHGKKIPGFVLQLPPEKIRALIEGYFSGDGYHDNTNNDWRVTTVSKSLALSFALLAQRAYGIVSSIRKCLMKPSRTIEGRVVNQRDFWIVSIPKHNRSAFVEGNYGWKLVRNSEPMGVGTVYNISVQEDESYGADGTVVHNCQPFSISGKRKGTDDDRHLWPFAFAIIKVAQPTWVIIENVSNFVGMALDLVQADLESEGYETQAYVLPACGVGAPHQRERVFVVAYSTRNRWNKRRTQCEKQQWPVFVERQSASRMAYTSGTRRKGCITSTEPTQSTGQQSSQSVVTPSTNAVGVFHTDGERCQKLDTSTSSNRMGLNTWSTAPARQEGLPQSRMGRESYGATSELDKNRLSDHVFPSAPHEPQHEWEPTRTTTRRQPNRNHRLKALGNAVVPQQIYPILKAIADIENGVEVTA